MLKVYMVAIVTNHTLMVDQSVGRSDIVVKFLRGARRLKVLALMLFRPGICPRSSRSSEAVRLAAPVA